MSHEPPLSDEQRARITPQMLGMSRRLAMIAWAKNKQQDGEELVSVAYHGLVIAARNFDPSRADIDPDDLESGRAFAGYARQRIAGSLMDWQRRADFVPRRIRKAYKDLQAIGHGDGDTTTRDLAATTGLDESAIRTVVAAVESMPISLDDYIDPREKNPQDEMSDADTVQAYKYSSSTDVESDVVVSAICAALAEAWAQLPFLQRAAVANKFYFGKSMVRASEEIGCSAAELRVALDRGMASILGIIRSAASEQQPSR